MLWERRDRSEAGLSGSMCIAVSCKIHQAESHPRHVKYSVYSWKWGIDLLYYIWISVFQIRVSESISKSVEVNLISNVTVRVDSLIFLVCASFFPSFSPDWKFSAMSPPSLDRNSIHYYVLGKHNVINHRAGRTTELASWPRRRPPPPLLLAITCQPPPWLII